MHHLCLPAAGSAQQKHVLLAFTTSQVCCRQRADSQVTLVKLCSLHFHLCMRLWQLGKLRNQKKKQDKDKMSHWLILATKEKQVKGKEMSHLLTFAMRATCLLPAALPLGARSAEDEGVPSNSSKSCISIHSAVSLPGVGNDAEYATTQVKAVCNG